MSRHLFRIWYNHIRPHQHLDGLTPAMAWNGKPANPRRRPLYFSEWKGVLTGFYVPSRVKSNDER